ncbi:MAG TPA: response regulator [Ktedonobacteraceae bacterium]|nr:response regulator [Ktedonobacteraceae bacterium]
MERQNCSKLRVLLAGQQTSFAHVLAANIQCWGYNVRMMPTTVPLWESKVDCDVLLYDLDDAYKLSTYLGGEDTRFSLSGSGGSTEWYQAQSEGRWLQEAQTTSVPTYLTIALSSRSVSRATLEQMGAVALLLKPFEMGQLQQYLRVIQRLLLEREARPQESRTRRILVVDDNVKVAEVIQRLLSGEPGYEVAVAHNGLEALELCLDWRPTCIVTDVIMPWMNGYQVIRCLAAGSLHTIPAFVITSALAQLEVPVSRSYLPEIPITYVNKPFTIDDLLTAVEHACSEHVS